MKYALIIVFSFSLMPVAVAEHLDLTQLLRQIQKTQGIEAKHNQQREQKFIQNKEQQQQLVDDLQAEFNQHNERYQHIKTQVDANEAELAQLRILLEENVGDLAPLFATSKQVAGDLNALLKNSLISAQLPQQRLQTLEKIAASKTLPTINEIEALWIILQEEMTESGRVVHFETKIQQQGDNATPTVQRVTRIGNFNAFSQGQYLNFNQGRLTVVPSDLKGDYQDMLLEMEKATSGLVDVGIDPTRGVVLSLLIKTPDVSERIQQGGIVGYIILIMGSCGFIFGLYRLLMLWRTGQKMNLQVDNEKIDMDNPLGRVFATAEQNQNGGYENLELLLDEAITREVPKLETGLSMLKLLAAVAPLLGLLGTVTGMIATFQSISLFGTGDPKLMANGISQALVTTMLGLCIAIPLLFLHSLAASRSRLLIQILDEQSAGLLSQRLHLDSNSR